MEHGKVNDSGSTRKEFFEVSDSSRKRRSNKPLRSKFKTWWWHKFVNRITRIKSRGCVVDLQKDRHASINMQAEITERMTNIESQRNKNRRRDSLFELEIKSMEADIRMKNAQAFAVESETSIKNFEILREHGLGVSVEVKSGNPQLVIVDSSNSPLTEQEILEEIRVESQFPG